MKTPHLVTVTERVRPKPLPVVSGLARKFLELFHVMRDNLLHPSQEKQLRLLETLPLGGRRQLMLVSCGKERFLIGSGSDSVQTIIKVAQEAKGSEQRHSVIEPIQGSGDQA